MSSAPYDSYDYQAYWEDRSFEDKAERIALERWLAKIPFRQSLVDIGGGFGRLSSAYVPLFKKSVVVDPSEKLLEIGRKRARGQTGLEFKKGGFPYLPFKDDSFEVALMIRVSHHLPDFSPVLGEVGRIIKKDGFLILEIANKIHFIARLKAYFCGNFSFCKNLSPLERRSSENIKKGSIDFSNHHPLKVMTDLKKKGFLVEEILSVSNLRSSFLKKVFPEGILLKLEGFLQKPLARAFFGPSVFILAKKRS